MRKREDIARDILQFNIDLSILEKELAQYPWDCPTPLVTICEADIIMIINKVLDGIISAEEIEDWADTLEMREEFEFKNDNVANGIYYLANPFLQGALTYQRLVEIKNGLIK